MWILCTRNGLSFVHIYKNFEIKDLPLDFSGKSDKIEFVSTQQI